MRGGGVGSCNAGGFGGHHQARHPYLTFYLPVAAVAEDTSERPPLLMIRKPRPLARCGQL